MLVRRFSPAPCPLRWSWRLPRLLRWQRGGVVEGSSTVEVGTGATGNDDDVLQPKNENTVAMIGSDEFETLQQAINVVKKEASVVCVVGI